MIVWSKAAAVTQAAAGETLCFMAMAHLLVKRIAPTSSSRVLLLDANTANYRHTGVLAHRCNKRHELL
jgi:hypothetical protein